MNACAKIVAVVGVAILVATLGCTPESGHGPGQSRIGAPGFEVPKPITAGASFYLAGAGKTRQIPFIGQGSYQLADAPSKEHRRQNRDESSEKSRQTNERGNGPPTSSVTSAESAGVDSHPLVCREVQRKRANSADLN